MEMGSVGMVGDMDKEEHKDQTGEIGKGSMRMGATWVREMILGKGGGPCT